MLFILAGFSSPRVVWGVVGSTFGIPAGGVIVLRGFFFHARKPLMVEPVPNRLVIRRGKFWHSQSGASFVHRFLASPSEERPQPLKVSWLATILLWYTFSNHHQNRRTAREAEAEEVNNRSRSHSPPVVGVNAPRTESFCRRRGARDETMVAGRNLEEWG